MRDYPQMAQKTQMGTEKRRETWCLTLRHGNAGALIGLRSFLIRSLRHLRIVSQFQVQLWSVQFRREVGVEKVDDELFDFGMRVTEGVVIAPRKFDEGDVAAW